MYTQSDSKDATLFKASSFQEGLFAATLSDASQLAYWDEYVIKVGKQIEPACVAKWWYSLLEMQPALRSVFRMTQDGFFYSILGQEKAFRDTFVTDFEENQGGDQVLVSGLSSRKPPVVLRSQQDSLVLSIHHALFDGSSINMILESLYTLLSPGAEVARAIQVHGSKDVEYEAYEKRHIPGGLSRQAYLEYLKGISLPRWPYAFYKPKKPCVADDSFAGILDVSITPRQARLALALSIAILSGSLKQVAFIDLVSTRSPQDSQVAAMLGHRIRAYEFDQSAAIRNCEELRVQGHDHHVDLNRIFASHPGLHAALQVLFTFHTPASLFDPRRYRDWQFVERRARVAIPLVLEFAPASAAQTVLIRYCSKFVLRSDVEVLMHTLNFCAQQIIHQPDQTVQECLNKLGSRNGLICGLAPTMPKVEPELMLIDMMEARSRAVSNKIAIQFGTNVFLTYNQLMTTASKLGRKLQELGIGPNDMIPICFEKGTEMVIAILSCLFARGAYVPLDPDHPQERLASILRQTEAKIIISGHKHCKKLGDAITQASKAANLSAVSHRIMTLDEVDQKCCHTDGRKTSLQTSIGDLAYVLFTSGSTGVPKGVMVENKNVVSFVNCNQGNATAQWHCRRLWLANYTFDASIGDLFATLLSTGTLAMVEQSQLLNDIPEALKMTTSTIVATTPTLGRLLAPAKTPFLRDVIFGGEPLAIEQLIELRSQVVVHNTCGPTETVVDAMCCVIPADGDLPFVPVGHPIAECRVYIVQLGSCILAPSGSPGEICIAGPQVSRGYLGQHELTQRKFIRDPVTGQRMFRTGDMGRLHGDGRIEHLGRIDGQFKLRGLRIEASEVETVAVQTCEEITNVIVDIFKPQTEEGMQFLIGGIVLEANALHNRSGSKTSDLLPLLVEDATLSEWFQKFSDRLNQQCKKHLPSYMIPTSWFLLSHTPLTPSGKTDRRALRSALEKLERNSALALHAAGLKPCATLPMDSTELSAADNCMVNACSHVLGLQPWQVHVTSSFAALGGNSIQAMRVIASLRDVGFGVELASLLDDKDLRQVAANMIKQPQYSGRELQGSPADYSEFLLAPRSWKLDLAASGTSVDPTQVQDVFPCTPWQKSILSFAMQDGFRSYRSRFDLSLPADISISDLQKAWADLLKEEPMLRTFFMWTPSDKDETVHHVVLKREVLSRTAPCFLLPARYGIRSSNMQQVEHNAVAGAMELFPYTACLVNKDHTNKVYLRLNMHHSIFDGKTVQLFLHRFFSLLPFQPKVNTGLATDLRPPCSFAELVYHYQKMQSLEGDSAATFWRFYMHNAAPAYWPYLPGITIGCTVKQLTYSSRQWSGSFGDIRRTARSFSVTPASVVRAALLATVQPRLEGNDVVIGEVSSCRSVPIPNIDHIAGPCISTHPLRLEFDASMSIFDLVKRTHSQYVRTLPFQGIALSTMIQSTLLGRTHSAFQVLFIYQQQELTNQDMFLQDVKVEASMADSHYPIVIQAFEEEGDQLRLEYGYQKEKVSEAEAASFFKQFESVLERITEVQARELNVCTLLACSHTESQEILQNCTSSTAYVDAPMVCLHDILRIRARKTPLKVALQSRVDGSFYTYEELDKLTDRVASSLQHDYQIEPCERIPICFEQGVECLVAILAILKVGCSFVPLDVSLPPALLSEIVCQVGASTALCSKSLVFQAQEKDTSPSFPNLRVLSFSTVFASALARDYSIDKLPLPDASQDCHVYFTSGSTGTPKGIPIKHYMSSSFACDWADSALFGWYDRHLLTSKVTFDPFVADMFATFRSGGTLLIDTEANIRSDLGSILALTATRTFLTPSVASIYRDALKTGSPFLNHVQLGGEAPPLELFLDLGSELVISNTYGVTETTVWASIFVVNGKTEVENLAKRGFVPLGKPMDGTMLLITNSEDPSQLAPVGSIGEIVIGGPQVSEGYISMEQLTRLKFIDNPHASGRLFRTGDLGRLNADGSIVHLGRRDAQVKLRGLRIELEAIEHAVVTSQASVQAAAAAVMTKETNEGNRQCLIMFLHTTEPCLEKTASGMEISIELTDSLTDSFLSIARRSSEYCNEVLPRHTVPAFWIKLRHIPTTSSGKINRRAIAGVVSDLSRHSLLDKVFETQTFSGNFFGEGESSLTDEERLVARQWGLALQLDARKIHPSHTFSALGGDSLSAMKVAVLLRKHGFDVDVFDILSKTLKQLSTKHRCVVAAGRGGADSLTPYTRFDLSPSTWQDETEKLGIHSLDVTDVFPATYLQQDLVVQAISQSETCASQRYVSRISIKLENLREDIPEQFIQRFVEAWRASVAQNPNLRTFFIWLQNEELPVYQAIVCPRANLSTRNAPSIFRCKNSKEVEHSMQQHFVKGEAEILKALLGKLLFRAAIFLDEGNMEAYVALVLHHSIFDATSLELFFEDLNANYAKQSRSLDASADIPEELSFARYVQLSSSKSMEETKKFWITFLKGSPFAQWPARSPRGRVQHTPTRRSVQTSWNGDLKSTAMKLGVTAASVVRGALAVCLAFHSDENDVVFGEVSSGRSIGYAGVEEVRGPCISTHPVRVQVERTEPISHAAQAAHKQYNDCARFQYAGLLQIRRWTERMNLFQVLFIYQNRHKGLEMGIDPVVRRTNITGLLNLTEFPVVLQAYEDVSGNITLSMDFNNEDLHSEDAEYFIKHIGTMLDAMQEASLQTISRSLNDIFVPDLQEEKAILSLAIPPLLLEKVQQRVEHAQKTLISLLEDQSSRTPSKIAIICPDGDSITYLDLHRRAKEVAVQLAPSDAGQLIPICYQPSIEMYVCILAILKAGAAFVPLDPKHPVDRLKSILEQCQPRRILCAASLLSLVREASRSLESCDAETLSCIVSRQNRRSEVLPKEPSAASLAYVLFTSGSTGKPKGVMVENGHVAAFLQSSSAIYPADWKSRFLVNTPYVFDIFYGDSFSTLVGGGCIVLPQPAFDPVTSAEDLCCTATFLTPSIATQCWDTVHPYAWLQHLILGGEAVPSGLIHGLTDKMGGLKIIGAYGPTEATIWSTYRSVSAQTLRTRKYGDTFPPGEPLASCSVYVMRWSTNGLALAPFGTVGEVFIGGLQVARGYLAQSQLTAQRFTSDPFISKGRMLRVGDLGRMHADGTLELLGRTDEQVKLHGQRVDLKEIEQTVRNSPMTATNVVVDVMQDETTGCGSRLIAFLVISEPDADEMDARSILESSREKTFVEMARSTSKFCALKLPSYMVPVIWLRIPAVPLTSSAKTDKQALRRLVKSFPTGWQNSGFANVYDDHESKAPRVGKSPLNPDPLQACLLKTWATVLQIDEEDMTPLCSFTSLGGNSLQAIKVAVALKQQGVQVSISDLLSGASAQELPLSAQEIRTNASYKRFSLLSKSHALRTGKQRGNANNSDARRCPEPQDLQDAYPCSPIQQGLLALSLSEKAAYVANFTCNLPSDLNLEHFQGAWSKLIASHDILRTVFVWTSEEGEGYSPLTQVVIHPDKAQNQPAATLDCDEISTRDYKQFVNETLQNQSHLIRRDLIGSIPMRGSLLKNTEVGHWSFLLSLHHCLFDGPTLRSLWKDLDALYAAKSGHEQEICADQISARSVPYAYFVAHHFEEDLDNTKLFWKKYLEALPAPNWPAAQVGPYVQADAAKELVWPGNLVEAAKAANVTPASIVRAALAATIAFQSGEADVAFGEVSTGRSIDLTGFENIMGPCISSHPVRVCADRSWTTSQLLKGTHSQYTATLKHNFYGVSGVQKDGPRITSDVFQILFVYQQGDQDDPTGDGESGKTTGVLELERADGQLSGLNYPIVLSVTPSGNNALTLFVNYDPRIVLEVTVELFLERLSKTLQRIAVSSQEFHQSTVAQLLAPGTEELAKLEEFWLPHNPRLEAPDGLLHAPFIEPWQSQSSKIAVHAIGEVLLSYGDVDRLSRDFAAGLIAHGIQCGDLVAICLERSSAMLIAIIGILKAGAAFLPLDPQAPESRQVVVVLESKATMVVVSQCFQKSKQQLLERFRDETTAQVQQFDTIATTKELNPDKAASRCSPTSLCYVIFTSGSTGTPKGIPIDHRRAVSMVHDWIERHNFRWEERCLLYTSYTFDPFICDMFAALTVGATIILDATPRHSSSSPSLLVQSAPTWTFLTPTVAQLLLKDLNHSTFLAKLILGGEALSTDVVRSLHHDGLSIINSYGVTETTVWASTFSASPFGGRFTHFVPLGKPLAGSTLFLADPQGNESLVGFGGVGEICIGGTQVANGYLNQEHTPKGAFTADFLLGKGMIFKTGDLGRMYPDGSMEHLGRRDNQVKVRGIRVELGEVERTIHASVSAANIAIVVDILSLDKEDREDQVLTAFFVLSADPTNDDFGIARDVPAETCLNKVVNPALASCRNSLIEAMIPKLWIPVTTIPLTTSGKTHRRKLKSLAATLTKHDLRQFSLLAGLHHSSEEGKGLELNSVNEVELGGSIESVTGIECRLMRKHDTFVNLGGDSLQAMRVSARLRGRGFGIDVADLLSTQTLEEVATKISTYADTTTREGRQHDAISSGYTAFSLLAPSWESQLRSMQIDPTWLEDAYPCTPTQQGILAASTKSNSFVATLELPLLSGLDKNRVKTAWNELVEAEALLRTSFVWLRSARCTLDSLHQLVWNCSSPNAQQAHMNLHQVHPGDDGEDRAHSYISEIHSEMIQGFDLDDAQLIPVRVALICARDAPIAIALTIHHALFDGTMLELLLQHLSNLYWARCVGSSTLTQAATPFYRVVEYTKAHVGANNGFWRQYLHEMTPSAWPVKSGLRRTLEINSSSSTQTTWQGDVGCLARKYSVTPASLVRAVVAMVLSLHSGTSDIIIGEVSSGRSCFIGCDEVRGPCLTVHPVRISIDLDEGVTEKLIANSHSSYMTTLPYQHTGMLEIQEAGGFGPSSLFQLLFIYQQRTKQAADPERPCLVSFEQIRGSISGQNYPIIVQAVPRAYNLELIADYDPLVICKEDVQCFIEHMKKLMHLLAGRPSGIRPRELFSAELQSDDVSRKSLMPIHLPANGKQTYLHEMVEIQSRKFPHKIAVQIDQRSFVTYSAISQDASLLAAFLARRYAIKPGGLIPLCLSEGPRLLVAILAVLKLGCAYVPIDYRHPSARITDILQMTSATLAIGSKDRQAKLRLAFSSCGVRDQCDVVDVDSFFEAVCNNRNGLDSTFLSPQIHTDSLAYVLFTSGTTGRPKGVKVTHGNVASFINNCEEIYPGGLSSRYFVYTKSTFDIFVGDAFGSLCTGGTLCFTESSCSPLHATASLCCTSTFLTPSVLAAFRDEHFGDWASLLVIGGEPVPLDLVKAYEDEVAVVGAYGPTEATIWASSFSARTSELTHAHESYPIGWALPSCSVYVLRWDSMVVCCIGEPGEICIGGPQVAQGYLGLTKLTEEKFQYDPFSNISGHLFRTGDAGRVTGMGFIEHLGRKDGQLKLRGQRIEASGVEHVLTHASRRVKAVVVDLVSPGTADAQLIALIQLREVAEASDAGISCQNTHTAEFASLARTLEAECRTRLPVHMVPEKWSCVDNFPLTSSGKMDRVRIRLAINETDWDMLDLRSNRDSNEGHKPQDRFNLNAHEMQIARIWSEVLKVDLCDIGPHTTFLTLGGNSLLALLASSRLRKLHYEIPSTAIIRGDSVETLGHSMVATKLSSANAQTDGQKYRPFSLADDQWDNDVKAYESLRQEIVEDFLPCTPFQRDVLSTFILGDEELYFGNFHFALPGLSNTTLLQKAWDTLLLTWPILRTAFVFSQNSGRAMANQVVIRFSYHSDQINRLRLDVAPEEQTLSDTSRICKRAILENNFWGNVPMRATLVMTEDETWTLCVTLHHSLFDGAMLQILRQDLFKAYESLETRTSSRRFAGPDTSFALYVRQTQGVDHMRAREFWARYLRGHQQCKWPQTQAIVRKTRRPANLQRQLLTWRGDILSVAKSANITMASVVRSAVIFATASCADCDDVVIGEVSRDARGEDQESPSIHGPCVATHPLRVNLDRPKETVQGFMRLVHSNYTSSAEHRTIGLRAILQAMQMDAPNRRELLFQVLFVFQDVNTEQTGGEQDTGLKGELRLDFDIVVQAEVDGSELQMTCDFDNTVIIPEDVQAWLDRVVKLLDHAVLCLDVPQAWERSMSHLFANSEEESAKILSMSTQPSSSEENNDASTLHRLFERQVSKTPKKIALDIDGKEFLTYDELLSLAQSVASALLRRGVVPGDLVPLAFDKGLELIVAVFAVMIAGAAYVPLDMSHPVERLASIVSQTKAKLLLMDKQFEKQVSEMTRKLQEASSSVVTIQAYDELVRSHPSDDRSLPSQSSLNGAREPLAYVMFTSGSTGTPKGVKVGHNNVLHFIRSRSGNATSRWDMRRLALAAHSFDVSVGDIFSTLSTGATLVLVPRDHLHSNVSTVVRERSISHLSLTPTFASLLDFSSPFLDTLIFGGEPLSRALATSVSQTVNVINTCGPTETVVDATYFLIQGTPDSLPFIPIGKPLGHSRIYLLAPGSTQLVPYMCTGEICIGGPQVSQGYLDMDELTASKFVADPFSPQGVMFRSGDLGRLHANGLVEHLGRIDSQLKLRGLRIEAEEVEAILTSVPCIDCAAVLKLKAPDQQEHLVALFQTYSNPTEAIDQMGKASRAMLPAYMVPTYFAHVKQIPRSSSGKLDRRKVMSIAETMNEQGDLFWNRTRTFNSALSRPAPAVMASTESERVLSRLIADIIGSEVEFSLDVEAPLQELGLNSLDILKLHASCRKHGIRLKLLEGLFGCSIRQICDGVDLRQAVSPHIFYQPSATASNCKMILVHPALGFTFPYKALRPHVQHDLVLISDPQLGLDDGKQSIENIAKHYTLEVERMGIINVDDVVWFGGWSFGGLVAFEMAKQSRFGNSNQHLLLIDTPNPLTSPRLGADNPELTALKNLMMKYKLPETMTDMLAAQTSKVARLCRQYSPTAMGKLLSWHFIQATQVDVSFPEQPLLDPNNWSDLMPRHSQPLQVIPFPAAHHAMFDFGVLPEMAQVLRRLVGT